jgi:membrane protease subunit HflC
MRRLFSLLLVFLAVLAALAWAGSLGIGPMLITREGEQKMVLFFGNPVAVRTEPGAWWRLPLLTDVKVFDSRFLHLNTPSSEVPTRDQERIVVDNYVIWRIADPEAFYKAFRDDVARAEQRINDTIGAGVKEEIGRRTIPELLTDERVEILAAITESARAELAGDGIEVKDVRINRTELPDKTIENVYARMRAERDRLARKYRAEGASDGRTIRAEADRDARITVAEARRDSEIMRGEGDARAAAIYAGAYNEDPEFYGFVRSLEAYRKTIGEDTTMVLPPSHDFFRALQSPDMGGRRTPAPAPASAP